MNVVQATAIMVSIPEKVWGSHFYENTQPYRMFLSPDIHKYPVSPSILQDYDYGGL